VCRELPQLRAQMKQMEDEKERLNDKVQKAAAQAAGKRLCCGLLDCGSVGSSKRVCCGVLICCWCSSKGPNNLACRRVSLLS
jgi:hypothetical protein